MDNPSSYKEIAKLIQIPEKYLNELGFLDYDHYGQLPHKISEQKLRLMANLPPEFFRHTKALAIDCEMIGIGERRDSVLARVSFVNQFGLKVYDRFVLPPKNAIITDYRTPTSGIREGDLDEAFDFTWIRSEIQAFLKNKILVGHSVHNDLEILNLTHPISKIRDTACYFKPKNRHTIALKELAKTHLNFNIQEGVHSSIQDAQATMKLYLMVCDEWEASLLNTSGIGPNDIKTINIAPRKGDITMNSGEVFLRSTKATYSSTKEYMDVQFRLLHEDFMRPFREGIHAYRYPNTVSPRQRCGAKIRTYFNVTPRYLHSEYVELRGTAKLTIPIRENKLEGVDWETSKTFINGSLVGLTPDNFKTIKFGTVSFTGPREARVDNLRVGNLDVQLFPDGPSWTVTSHTKFLLIESIPFFEGYQRSLEAFQTLELDKFPVKKYIVDGVIDFDSIKHGDPEAKINLSCFIRNPELRRDYKLLDPSSWPSAAELGFNESQCQAFKGALTQEFSIIQGPPGTGKTFTGLAVIKAYMTNPHLLPGPIMIVAQTNHALDHLLEGVLRFAKQLYGSTNRAEDVILRIGGGSRSDEIHSKLTLGGKRDKLNWKFKVKNLLPLYAKGYRLAESFYRREVPFCKENLLSIGDELLGIQDTLKQIINEIRCYGDKASMKFLMECNKVISQYFNDLFRAKRFDRRGEVELRDIGILRRGYTIDEIKYQLAMKDIILEILPLFKEEHDRMVQEWQEMKYYRGNCTKGILVIGCTATGACKYKERELKKLKPGILIVEEAGHVLEAHIVAGLTEHIKQVILIGDHQQLRPSTSDYQLTRQYGVDISLMERLVTHAMEQGKKNWVQLNVQHRMRPEIAKLITPTIYPELFNAENVLAHPPVRGINKNLFFFQHCFREMHEKGSTSFINPTEAEFIHKLCLYFLFQGYREDRISVITTYLGQKNLLDSMFKGNILTKEVRVSCVDGFQGEENDIILLSLVRNNAKDNIGFMDTDNRLCVALSRARQGLFIVGNMTSLSHKSKTWNQVNETLKSMDSIGDKMELCCNYHKSQLGVIGCGYQFPVARCNSVCSQLLLCGHKCKLLCHINCPSNLEYESHECELYPNCGETKAKLDTECLVTLLNSIHILDSETESSPTKVEIEKENGSAFKIVNMKLLTKLCENNYGDSKEKNSGGCHDGSICV